MMEANSSKIVISDMTATTFRGNFMRKYFQPLTTFLAFLEYLYSEDVELNATLAKDLLTQADKYSVPKLKGLCERFLLGYVGPDNYVQLANLSELLEANKLRDAVKMFIKMNLGVLQVREDFEGISMEVLRDLGIKGPQND